MVEVFLMNYQNMFILIFNLQVIDLFVFTLLRQIWLGLEIRAFLDSAFSVFKMSLLLFLSDLKPEIRLENPVRFLFEHPLYEYFVFETIFGKTDLLGKSFLFWFWFTWLLDGKQEP